MHGLLEILRGVRSRGIGSRGRRRGDAGGVGCFYVELLAEWRHRCGRDPLGEALVVDEGDVEDAEALGAAGGVEIFAPHLHLEHLASLEGTKQHVAHVAGLMVVGHLQHAVLGDMFAKIIRKRDPVELAADHRLRFLLFGDDHARQAARAEPDPGEFANEIRVVGALHQELGHDRVVVVGLRDVAVGAHLCLVGAGPGCGVVDRATVADRAAAYGVGHVRAEGDAAQALG